MAKTKSNSIVRLRTKSLSSGDKSLYLDIYHNGQRSYDFLKLYIKGKPKNQAERQSNKEIYSLAESIRSKKELEIKHTEQGFIPEHRKRTNFLTVFQKFKKQYQNKDNRLVNAVFNKFKTFIGKEFISCSEVNKSLVEGFKIYLQKNMNGETPSNYFKKFKLAIDYAVTNKYLVENVAKGIFIERSRSVKKEILTIEEIQNLANTQCSNKDLKNAFLFSCFTGLRYGDVKSLKWKYLFWSEKEKRMMLHKWQNKTDTDVYLNLKSITVKLLGERKENEELVFNLPTTDGANKVIKNWVKKAGINKHITTHCARHSFGTNLLLHTEDIKSVSSLMGHASVKETEKYARLADSLKQKALDSLPEIDL